MSSEEMAEVCGLCERPTDADGPDLWVDLEVIIGGGTHYASFCRQEHAAEWLARPLPGIEDTKKPETMLDRLILVMLGGVLLGLVATWGLGCVTLARWLIG